MSDSAKLCQVLARGLHTSLSTYFGYYVDTWGLFISAIIQSSTVTASGCNVVSLWHFGKK